jgi:hypothetical protein
MKNEFESKFLLSVFDKIRQHGEHRDNAYHLEGIKAFTDFDGYTIFLEDAKVKLNYGFHNQYRFDYQSGSDKDAFEKKLQHINNQY